MSTWVKADEAAEILKCAQKTLSRTIANASRDFKIGVKTKETQNPKRTMHLYCKEDLLKAAEGRVRIKRKNQYHMVGVSMWHPVMTRPWNPEGLRGVFG